MAPKKSKSKKTVTPPKPAPPPPQVVVDDDTLMNDLLAQLDSKDEVVRQESATVLKEMEVNEIANDLDHAPKKDNKARFKARQVGSFRPFLWPFISMMERGMNRPRRLRHSRTATLQMMPKRMHAYNVRRRRRKLISNGYATSWACRYTRCEKSCSFLAVPWLIAGLADNSGWSLPILRGSRPAPAPWHLAKHSGHIPGVQSSSRQLYPDPSRRLPSLPAFGSWRGCCRRDRLRAHDAGTIP